MTGWKEEQLFHEPELLESDGTATGLVQRRNIVHHDAVTSENEFENKPEYWSCETRFLTVSEYEMLNAMQNIVKGQLEV